MRRLQASGCRRQEAGLTLIELVVAMSLTVVVLAFMTLFMSTPMTAYQAQARRADLVDSADSVLRFMARDVRAALPNSVRVRVNGTSIVIEMMNTIDGARYRSTGSLTTPDQDLDFAAADNKFTTVGRFGARRPPPSGYVGYLAIYAISAAEIYNATPGVMSPPGQLFIDANPLDADEDQVTLSSAFKFKYQSPSQRVYLVSGPITYLCDTTARTMRRYEGYSIAASQVNRDTDAELMAAGATRSLIANDVGACTFDYTNGTPTRAALVTLSLTLTRTTPGNAPESVRLLRQVHMENTP